MASFSMRMSAHADFRLLLSDTTNADEKGNSPVRLYKAGQEVLPLRQRENPPGKEPLIWMQLITKSF